MKAQQQWTHSAGVILGPSILPINSKLLVLQVMNHKLKQSISIHPRIHSTLI